MLCLENIKATTGDKREISPSNHTDKWKSIFLDYSSEQHSNVIEPESQIIAETVSAVLFNHRALHPTYRIIQYFPKFMHENDCEIVRELIAKGSAFVTYVNHIKATKHTYKRNMNETKLSSFIRKKEGKKCREMCNLYKTLRGDFSYLHRKIILNNVNIYCWQDTVYNADAMLWYNFLKQMFSWNV